MSKAALAVELSKLKPFTSQKVKLEQYPTDSQTAADILWNANLLEPFNGKIIADLGCGTGILGIGALLLGARKAFFIEQDQDIAAVLSENLRAFKDRSEVRDHSVEDFNEEVDIVVQNPPFGAQQRHTDTIFLFKAMHVANTVYSIHNAVTNDFILKFIRDNGAAATHFWDYDLPIKRAMKHHAKPRKMIQVRCWRIQKA